MATVNMDDLKPNSNSYKESKSTERKKLDPVVKSGAVVSTKKPLGQKFKDVFIGEDINDLKRYIVLDMLIPGAKRMILNIMKMMFFGDTEPDYYYDHRGNTHTNYTASYRGSSYRASSRRRERERRYEGDEKVDYQNVVLRNRMDAEDVVDQMRERIRRYGYCSIADLFDLINVTGNYNDNNWGWKDERDIGIRRISSGFLINVRDAEYLDD